MSHVMFLATIDVTGHAAAYLLTKTANRLAALVEQTAGDKVGDGGTELLQLRFKQPVLTVYPLCLDKRTPPNYRRDK